PVRTEWVRKGHTATLEQLYDSIMVYGSRAVYDPVRAYRLAPEIAAKLVFTGYLGYSGALTPRAKLRRKLGVRSGRRLALCTLGGGQDGAEVASSFVAAIGKLRGRGWCGLLVTGPFMLEADRAIARSGAPDNVEIRRFLADIPSHLAASDAVLCMGGYNTLCEVLSVNASAVVVPR